MRPMLATPGDPGAGPPAGPGWAHEIKWDGIRLLADVSAGALRLLTRGGRDIAPAFPELQALGALADDLLLDGEAVALLDGRPSFSHVVERVHTSTPAAAQRLSRSRPATYVAFDLLRLDGLDLTPLPWSARRQALEEVLQDVHRTQLSPVFEDGAQLLAATREQGLEGVLSKRRDAAYRPGERSGAWLKFPHRQLTSVVVGGWNPQTGTADRLGAVHVGVPVDDGTGRPARGPDGALRLAYLGRVGSGLAGRAGERLRSRLAELARSDHPFTTELPRAETRGATWLAPEVVIDVASLGLTPGDGRLRQPSFQGERDDLAPADLLEHV